MDGSREEWAVIRSWTAERSQTAIRQKKVDVDIDNIPQPQLKYILPEPDANC